jgi:hypothetical protein
MRHECAVSSTAMSLQPIVNTAASEAVFCDDLLWAFAADHSVNGVKPYAVDISFGSTVTHVWRFMK